MGLQWPQDPVGGPDPWGASLFLVLAAAAVAVVAAGRYTPASYCKHSVFSGRRNRKKNNYMIEQGITIFKYIYKYILI